MRWTWDYLGNVRTLHDCNHSIYITDCAQISVVREVDTGMPPSENELEDRVQQSAGRVWLFNYLDARILRLTLSIFGKQVNTIGSRDIQTAKRILAQWFNPQPSAPDGILTFYSDDGTVRAINARYDQGLEYDWLYTEQGEFVTEVRLLCADPLWYDPVLQQTTWGQGGAFSSVLCEELCSTLCEGVAASQTAVNAGDWATYPIVTVLGPASDVTILNSTTGEGVSATYSIAAGQTVTYDFRPGRKTVFDSLGNNLMSTLLQPNDLASFHLACAYEYNDAGVLIAPGGINNVIMSSGASTTSAIMTWYNRYLTN